MPQDSVQIPGVLDPHSECTGNEEEEEEAPGPGDQPQEVPSPPGGATHTDETEETVITSTKFISLHSLQILLMTR